MIGLLSTAWAIGPATLPEGKPFRVRHETTLHLPLQVRLAGTLPYVRPVERQHLEEFSIVHEAGSLLATWHVDRQRILEPGFEADRALPVVGRTYRVRGERITREDGSQPDDAELDTVRQLAFAEQQQAIRAMLGDRPAVGDVLPAGPVFAGILDPAPGDPELIAGQIHYAHAEEGRAHFTVTLHLRSVGDERGASVQTDLHLHGELVVRERSGLTERLSLQGELVVEARRPGLQTTGRGTYTSTTTVFE